MLRGYLPIRVLRSTSSSELVEATAPDGRSVVLKIAGGRFAERLAVEHAILLDLAGIEGVSRALGLELDGAETVLILEGLDEADLRTRIGRLDLVAAVEHAVQLARILRDVHQAGVVHRDIKPANILISPGGALRLIDFGLSTSPSRARPESRFEGTLAYMSPEQTGRMECDVDARADLYALGVTLFEMLTGRLPFERDSPLDYVQAHLAARPPRVDALLPQAPAVLVEIVDRLLAKDRERRYQTAQGLLADLEAVHERLRAGEAVEAFPLGRADRRRHLGPGRLFGRARVVHRLVERIVGAAAEGSVSGGVASGAVNGGACTLLIGDAGIGKSSVVDAVRQAILQADGLVLDGKFEQYRTVQPYSAFAQALERLADQILGAPDAVLGAWTGALVPGLGPLASVLVDLAPRFAAIFGPVEPPPAARPDAARHRVLITLQRLVDAAASVVAGPIVWVLDDLQWADPGSLWLLGGLLNSRLAAQGRFAVLSAARPAEPPPWVELVADLAAAGRPAHIERLEALTDRDIAALVADLTGRPPEEAADLARLTADRADHNPLLARQFLTFLVETGRLRPHPDGGWQWDLDEVVAAGLPATLAETLTARLDRLPRRQRDVLTTAACVGAAFEPHLVFEMLDLTRPAFDAALAELRQQGLLTADARTWRFAHDRIQEAAHQQLTREARQHLHRRLGAHLLQATRDGSLDAHIFTIADHQNQGGPPDDPPALARLNLVAGQRAIKRGAWQAAAVYLQAGLDLLPPVHPLPALAPNPEDPTLARLRFELAFERAQAVQLNGDHADADARFTALLATTTAPEDRIRLLFRRVVLQSAADRMADALDTGLAALAENGLHLRPTPLRTLASLIRALIATRPNRASTWINQPPLEDPHSTLILRLMASLNGAAYALDKRLLVHLLSRTVTELAARGRTPWGAIVLGNFAIILLGRGHIRPAIALANVAETLGADLPPDAAVRLAYILHMFVRPWHRPFAESLPPMRVASRQAHEHGDIEYGLLHTTGLHMLSFFGAGHLGQLEADLAHSRAELGPYATGSRLMMQEQMQRCVGHLTGRIPLDAESLARGDVPGDRANVIERRMVIAVPLLCIFGRFDLAAIAAERIVDPDRQRFFGIAFGPVFRFYRAFAHLCAATAATRRTASRLGRAARRRLAPLAHHNPANFGAFLPALDAELYRLAHRPADALTAYARAADSAAAHGNRLLHALIEERFAALYTTLALPAEARVHLAQARQIYAAWGATAKVDALLTAHPRLAEPAPTERPELSSLASTSSLHDVGHRLDMATVWNVARELSGDLRLDSVVAVVLEAALHNAAATTGLLALTEPDATLRAVGRRTVDGPHQPLDAPLAALADAPHHLMRYVARTRQPLVLDRADQSPIDDPALAARPAAAILCVPLATREGDVGVLYLENDRITGAFTHDRTRVLQLIGMQAAVSLTNARLHQATERLAETLEQRVLQRTAELAIARDAALEATRAKSAFLAAMSHEIRTPMNGLLGTAQLLAHTRLDPRQRDYVDIIEGSADSLLTVLNDILDFSKIEAGRFEIEHRPFSLRDTVDASAQLVAELADRKNIDLVVQMVAGVPDRVIGDGIRLRQILLNLIGNAIKFTEDGHVELSVRPARTGIVRFEVIDSGIGIRPELIDRLFQPFSQADDSISRRFGGTGLGLAICKRLVELMGGHIGVTSTLGQGSTFWFELPLALDDTAAIAPPPTAPIERPALPATEAIRRVLVVEDNLVNQKITRWMLERQGYQCVVVGDGLRALEAEEHTRFDAILMDCQMPEMDGLEATRRLRARGCTLPIIALSAGALEDERAACLEAGMDGFVPKPIKMPELLAALSDHLAARSH